MRRILATLLAFTTFAGTSVSAQQSVTPPPAGSDWQHVQALPIGASIQVQARKSHANCNLKSVDADTLTCTHRKDIVFQRADILTIRVPRRGRSALAGMGIGAGAGAVFGYAASGCQSPPCFIPRPAAAGIFAVPGAVIGALTGLVTDFTRSTVYKAP
jgi:hypothetical protein